MYSPYLWIPESALAIKSNLSFTWTDKNSVNVEKWCSCIDGALTKENYLDKYQKSRIQQCSGVTRNTIFGR
jgi:hypothetical protein